MDAPDPSAPPPEEPTNPLEALLRSLGANVPEGGIPGIPPGFDLGSIMGQMQAMFAPYEGSVNWGLATDIARRTVATTADPSTSTADRDRTADVFRLADHWLDEATDIPSGISTTAAWSRAEWVEGTMPVWKVLVEPVAQHVVAAMSTALPDEARAAAGPLLGFIGKAGGAMFGSQAGQAIGTLAGEVLTSSDIGLPLGPSGTAALVTANVADFADGLGLELHDVELYLALREAAHQRLFAHVPWLRGHLVAAVEDYGRGVTIDVQGVEESLRGLDPMNPAALQDALGEGLFDPPQSPAQKSALQRLETLLALVEGWVDEVVGQVSGARMPNAGALQEAIRRRRAAGGPAEETFAALVGLELRPRRLRDASTLWGSLRSRKGAEARDAVWGHPDLLPTAADLDDPLGFGEASAEPTELSAEDFDRELDKLLGGDSHPDEPPAE
ncbi:MAG: zinc-dependent metalloprotease [Marmoricola sp.]